jgi:hypothetical protein
MRGAVFALHPLIGKNSDFVGGELPELGGFYSEIDSGKTPEGAVPLSFIRFFF